MSLKILVVTYFYKLMDFKEMESLDLVCDIATAPVLHRAHIWSHATELSVEGSLSIVETLCFTASEEGKLEVDAQD